MSASADQGADTPPVDLAHVIPLVPAWRVDRSFVYRVPEKLTGKIQVGSLVKVSFGTRNVRAVVLELESAAISDAGSSSGLGDIGGVVVDAPIAPDEMIEVLDALALRYAVPRGRAFERAIPPRVRVPRIDVQRQDQPRPRRHLDAYDGAASLRGALEAGTGGTFLIEARPNEDRAALVIDLISCVPAQRSSLVLVPEVRYGSKVLEGLAAAHPGLQRVDSSRDDMARASAWIALARGAYLGAGGRAAIFAPMPALGLIVVDEEHHLSLKEERSPRYDARWVAIERAARRGAACVFISASPSVEAGHAARCGRWTRLAAPRQAVRSAWPAVELVDPPDAGLSERLHHAVRDALRAGERVALLSPLAGFASALWCGDCRRSLRCPRCESGLVFEREARVVRCARCELRRTPPDSCPYCGSHAWRYLGAGSERLDEQLRKAFPRARLVRIDPSVLSAEAALDVGDADIYLTTWIGTKEVLRPPVSLVGVLAADQLIRRPDFRAAEHAFHALAEMAEWAGAADGGRLIVQTSQPAHHSIQATVRGDPQYFLERELPLREELGYPPFSELVRLRATGEERRLWIDTAVDAARTLGARVLGPIAVPAEEPTLEVLIKHADASEVSAALRGILPNVPRTTRLRVDVDPR